MPVETRLQRRRSQAQPEPEPVPELVSDHSDSTPTSDSEPATPEPEGYTRDMNDLDLRRYRGRVAKINSLNTLLYKLCFDKTLLDKLTKKRVKSMGPDFGELYHAFDVDAVIVEWNPPKGGPGPGPRNIALRWRIMAYIWMLLQEHIFDQLSETDKNPLSDPLLCSMREVVVHKIRQYLIPFRDEKASKKATKALDDMIDTLCSEAKNVLNMLLIDNDAGYSFFIAGDPREECAELQVCDLEGKIKEVDICGASHLADKSKNVVYLCGTGGLMRHTWEGGDVHETRAWVLVYRPEEGEYVPANTEEARSRAAYL